MTEAGKRKFENVPAGGVSLTFSTTLTGDEVRCAAGVFFVKQKSACERWLDLVPTDHRSHAYPTRVREFDFNRGGFTLVTPAGA